MSAEQAKPSVPDIDALIMTALQAHQAGRLVEATELYARALKANPDHPDALNLAGACAFARGETEAAIRLISKAIRVHPAHLDAYVNLAEALEKAGRISEAIETCRRALALSPAFADAHVRLAGLLAECGPYDQAVIHADAALETEPDLVEALRAKGKALWRLQDYLAAEKAYTRALALAPDDLRSLTGYATFLTAIDRSAEAAELYRRSHTLAPKHAQILMFWAHALERSNDLDGALAVYDRALALAPNSAEILSYRAGLLRDMGDFDSAEAGFREALAIDPNHSPAIYALVRMKRFEFDGPQRERIEALVSDPSLAGGLRVQAGFALGELLDRAGDPDAAFERYAEANRLHRSLYPAAGHRADPATLLQAIRTAEQGLALEYARDTGAWGSHTDLPVFVVGLPRSGTSLVEQICASHSQVVGAGELAAIAEAQRVLEAHNRGRKRIADWDAAFARAWAKSHALKLTRLANGARRVVDKWPLNFARLHLIGALFPNARVIWCRRDPRDVIVSNYTMFFGDGICQTTDLLEWSRVAMRTERLGSVFARHSKLAILNVAYEELVSDLDRHVRRIIDFLGLDWEPGCLDFDKTTRRVGTPSSWQVRQPVYTSSIGRWRRYEKHLGPMFEALAEPL